MEKNHTIKVHEHGFVKYLDHMGSDLDIVSSARLSYASESKGEKEDINLLRYLIRNKHTSPLEMGKIRFGVKMPIFVARQWMRHRTMNVNEVSARYTELPSDFYVPEEFRANNQKNKQSSGVDDSIKQGVCRITLEQSYATSYLAYKKLLAEGVAREQARMVLPVGIYTEIIGCFDMNNLLKFFKLRDDSHAQAEIQDYARALKVIATEFFPETMRAYDDLIK